MSIAGKAARLDRQAEHNDALDASVRIGLVAYGVVHLLIAWLAVRLVFGGTSHGPSANGALEELASTVVGRVSLYVVAAGLFGLAVWQLIEALGGHRDVRGGRRAIKRLSSAGRMVVYAFLGVTAVRAAVGASSGGSTDGLTAKLMSLPAGPAIVALVGVGIIVVAGLLAYRGWSDRFMEALDFGGRTGSDGRAYRVFGKVGHLSKGVALAIVGGLFVWAALTHDPHKSGGLGQALSRLLAAPLGGPLLLVVAAGIACYGMFCLAWARHLEK